MCSDIPQGTSEPKKLNMKNDIATTLRESRQGGCVTFSSTKRVKMVSLKQQNIKQRITAKHESQIGIIL